MSRKVLTILHATFPSTLGQVTVALHAPSVTLVAGPNGVGKSALLHQLYRSLPQGAATYLPGHRQINFNNSVDQLGQDARQLQLNFHSHFDAFSRYKGAWSEDQFKVAIRGLMHSEAAFNRCFRQEVVSLGVTAVSSANIKNSPVDTLNLIFENGGLQVRFILDENGLTATRHGSNYSIEALSDGERAALFIASSFITQPTNTALLIDEPEKHLHPSISGALLDTALRSRNDLSVVFSTHDFSLIEYLNVQNTIYVRDSSIIGMRPEVRQYDIELIEEGVIPEGLKADVLGSRSRILFIEGTDTSRDTALYSKVYSGYKIVPKGGAEKVLEAVGGLTSSGSFHWLEVNGLIDRDGRSQDEVYKLKQRRIICLPTPTVENLFFIEELQRSFVEADLNLRGGLSWDERQEKLKEAVATASNSLKDEVVARRVCWEAQRAISSHPLSVKSIKNGSAIDIVVELQPIKERVASEIAKTLTESVGDILLKLPIKNTDIPDLSAKALGAASFKDYCAVIQRQIDIGSPSGLAALAALKVKLPNVSAGAPMPVQLSQNYAPRVIGMR